MIVVARRRAKKKNVLTLETGYLLLKGKAKRSGRPLVVRQKTVILKLVEAVEFIHLRMLYAGRHWSNKMHRSTEVPRLYNIAHSLNRSKDADSLQGIPLRRKPNR